MSQQKNSSIPLIGGALAAVAASLCCIGPLVLVMLGMGGVWVSSLSAMEPFRPYLLVIAIIFLFFAWKKIYRAPAAACTPGSLCAKPHTNNVYKVLFWIMAALIVIALASPYIAPLFY
jgi:mercuric ion transport protein